MSLEYKGYKVSPGAQQYIDDLKAALRVAKCPNSPNACDGEGHIQVAEDDWEPCQWCHERQELLKD